MVILLVILAFIALGIGLFTLSEATMGVGILAVGCFFAILARIAQASHHHNELKLMQQMHKNS